MAIESSSFWVGPPTEPVTYQPVKTLGTGGEGKRGGRWVRCPRRVGDQHPRWHGIRRNLWNGNSRPAVDSTI